MRGPTSTTYARICTALALLPLLVGCASVLKAAPAASSAGAGVVTLAFQAGRKGAVLQVKGNGQKATLNVSLRDEPADAPDAKRVVIAASVDPHVGEETSAECGLALDPNEYAEVRLHVTAMEVLWVVQAQRPLRDRCWEKTKKAESYTGWVMKDPGDAGQSEAFEVVVLADSHLYVPEYPSYIHKLHNEHFEERRAEIEEIFAHVSKIVGERCARERTAFVLQLGDPFDLHGTRKFMPPLDTLRLAEKCWGYMASFYTSPLASCGPIYNVVGNWEGETNCAEPAHRRLATQVRSMHFPPAPEENPNWYKVSHGPLLVVVLHVTHSSPKCHAMLACQTKPLEVSEGFEDDFRLGEEQQAFVKDALTSSRHAFKAVAVHHPFGGSAGDEKNARYGRGGAKAAKIGEQRWLHELMVNTGTQVMLHGHDHLFNDEVVDGVHYTCVGTASAPWAFVDEGAYSTSRPGADGRYGTTRLAIPAGGRRLDVFFIDHNGKRVGGYHVDASRVPRPEL